MKDIALLASYGLALAVTLPLFLGAWLAAMLPGLPIAVRGIARAAVLTFVYLALFEISAVLGTAARRRVGERADQDLLTRLLRRFFGTGFALASMRLACLRPPPELPGRPVVVLSRHAGAFNSLLVLHLIDAQLHRRTQTVGKSTAAVLPGLRRLLTGSGIRILRFDRTGKIQALLHLRRVAGRADAADALLLFPEGANYTASARRRAIDDLRARGEHEQADRAARLTHLLHPNPVGARLLVTGAEHADVLILAHTGLEDLLACTGRTDYPVHGHGTVHTAWWHTPADLVPRTAELFDKWLGEQWRTADDWIATVRNGVTA